MEKSNDQSDRKCTGERKAIVISNLNDNSAQHECNDKFEEASIPPYLYVFKKGNFLFAETIIEFLIS